MPRSDGIFAWDELELIRQEAIRVMALPPEERKKKKDDFCDYLEYVLCLIYAYGWQDAEEIIGIVPFRDGLDDKCVNLDIANKTFRDRVDEQFTDGTAEGVLRIIDTESLRDYNTGVYDCGIESGENVMKQWHTMRDMRVRDSHTVLEGQVVGIDDLFYTGDDSAMAPGGFTDPSNNVNCRCWITLLKK